MMQKRKNHWETVYRTKNPDQVSWTQDVPKTSLELIQAINLDKRAKIIDVGGGDGKLVDFLLNEGFENITVLDISGKAIERAQSRLGDKARKVTWVECDITDFYPEERYDVWHDRAAFHFFTEEDQIQAYVNLAEKAVLDYLILGTFSENGPKKCSGLDIKQYNEVQMAETFQNFTKISCRTLDHITPFGTKQNFTFCSFKRMGG